MNHRYWIPDTWRSSPPSAPPNTTMKSTAVTTGGRIVCVQSFDTRRTSRPDSASMPRRDAARSSASPSRASAPSVTVTGVGG